MDCRVVVQPPEVEMWQRMQARSLMSALLREWRVMGRDVYRLRRAAEGVVVVL
jgi:hypothetical protein